MVLLVGEEEGDEWSVVVLVGVVIGGGGSMGVEGSEGGRVWR